MSIIESYITFYQICGSFQFRFKIFISSSPILFPVNDINLLLSLSSAFESRIGIIPDYRTLAHVLDPPLYGAAMTQTCGTRVKGMLI